MKNNLPAAIRSCLVAVLALTSAAVIGAEEVPAAALPLAATAVARQIDELFVEHWRGAPIEPAAPACDAEFVRRLYLDLAGRIPAVSEVETFLADGRPDKRQQLIRQLLTRASFSAHLASVLRELLLPMSSDDVALRQASPRLELWLRLKLIEHTKYDQLVRDLLTARIEQSDQAAIPTLRPTLEPSPLAFYTANELKPQNLAGSASRFFLGVQLQCAECHDHPFADWNREQFWELAAFFNQMGKSGAVSAERRLQIEIADTGTKVDARFLDGRTPPADATDDPRALLAQWMTSRDNPYFARALVNRLWSHFFGLGFVEPVDDLNPANPPSQPAVFELLVTECIAHDFDLSFLVEVITSTRAYQLSSEAATSVASGDDGLLRHFARMPVRSLSAEQLFDSVVEATGYREPPNRNRNSFDALLTSTRAQFLARFAGPSQHRTEGEASILQALTLMNGALVAEVTSVENSQTLRAVAEAPFLSPRQKVETLFLGTLSRPPRADEIGALMQLLAADGDEPRTAAVLSDVFWALLNSSEFLTNH